MKCSFLILFCYFLSIIVFVHSDSTIPVLFWSGETYFPENVQYLETVTTFDVEYILDVSCGIPTRIASTLDVYAENLMNAHPEVVTIYLQPKLRTDQLSQLNSAYHNTAGKDGLFPNFKASLEASSSSLVLPYSTVPQSGTSATILQVASDLKRFSPSSSVFFVSNQGSKTDSLVPRNSEIVKKTPASFLDFIKNNEEIFTNNITDLIIIAFDESVSSSPENNFRNSDIYLGAVQEVISKKTQGKYISVFTADRPGTSLIQRSHSAYDYPVFEEGSRAFARDPAPASDTYPNYWPGLLIQMLLSSLLLIIIALVGICCNVEIQPPQKYEVPRQRRGDMM